jgi:hypothetical protein
MRLLASVVTVLLTASVSAAQLGAGRAEVERRVLPGGIEQIEPLSLEAPTVFNLAIQRGKARLRVTPDGFLQVLDAKVNLSFTVTGARANHAKFNLAPGDCVSIWPLESISVREWSSSLVVEAVASSWAFAVRADKVRRGALSVQGDGKWFKLRRGERLDTDREGDQVVFRMISKEVEVKEVPKTIPRTIRRPRVPRPPAPVREPVEGIPEPVVPGVLTDRSLDHSWQTIPLPVIGWEAFRPPDVSP